MTTQSEYVTNLMKNNNGYLSLSEIYKYVEEDKNSPFKSKTYKESIRGLLQKEKNKYFRIKEGTYGLNTYKDRLPKEILDSIQEPKISYYDEITEHAQIQANLIGIGKELKYETYIPSQDKNRKVDESKRLIDIVDTIVMPQFTYERVIRKIRTIDVIWFERISIDNDFYKYPKVVFEVDHTTDIKNSINKFMNLKSFNIQYMFIITPRKREVTFNRIIKLDEYKSICKKIKLLSYEEVRYFYENPKSFVKFDLI